MGIMHVQKPHISFYQEDKQFLLHSYSSKKEFSEEYRRIYFGKPRAKDVYLVVVAELENAIIDGNVDNFKLLSESIHYIIDIESLTLLETYYNDEDISIKKTNLVTLACKLGRIEILKHIFSDLEIFKSISMLAGKHAILPGDENETSHDAFYYAIRSSNTEILDILIDNWPGDYFATRYSELDEVLSRAYERLVLQNVSLSDEMKIFVKKKLINLRFFSDSSDHVQSAEDNRQGIRKRIELILKNIALLKSGYSKDEEVDGKFLFVGRFIAQNIYILKQQLKSTYDRLPWEEIEFCLVAFVSSYLKQQECNLFYRAILNKSKIIFYLENFAIKLESIISFVETLDLNQPTKLPKLNREQVVKKITRDVPEFLELYIDYQKIRDAYSLEKVGDYLNLILSTNPKEPEGQIIITRALHVIGEYFKNTLESPNLSSTTVELLLLYLPESTRKVIVELRNSLSHAYSLSKIVKIYDENENTDPNFFISVQNDIKRMNDAITNIFPRNKIRMIEIILKKMINTESVCEMMALTEIMSIGKAKLFSPDFIMKELENMEKLIQQMSGSISVKTNYEKELFEKIERIIDSAKMKRGEIRFDYNLTLTQITSMSIIRGGTLFDDDRIEETKFHANQILKNCIPQVEPHSFKEIAELSMVIYSSAVLRTRDNLDTIKRLAYEIFYIAVININDNKWIEKLNKMLQQNDSSILLPNGSKNCYVPKDKYEYDELLTNKLSELKNILVKDSSSNELIDYKSNKKLQAVLEMLILDILSILDESGNNLENNLTFLDDKTPLLIGKSLLNHLKHENALIDLLLDPSLAVILNAEKLVSENVMQSKRKVGMVVKDDPSKLKLKFDQDLSFITNQENMFAALLGRSLEELKIYLDNGADINARSINLSSTLHFAAQGGNLEMINFIVDLNVPINVENIDDRTPLHIAAYYGRKNIVEFFLKQASIIVNKYDAYGKTPLHFSAENGQKDIVEILLKNNARTDITDSSGHSPLHYAVKNNHIEVVKILLEKEYSVDTNEMMLGFTLLHTAAEFGFMEIADLLLKNGANVNAKNIKNGVPLHTAALKGHLELVNMLILKGADVNIKTEQGCTALHFALENGCVKVAEVLLKHGAAIDIGDDRADETPLHYAAKYGHEQIVKILLSKKANANITNTEGVTPLHFAVRYGHLSIVSTLLKHGADIHAGDISNSTAIHRAATNGYKEIAQLLIQEGAIVNAKAFDNMTPLYMASIEGYEYVVDVLINNGANIFDPDSRGCSPLLIAAEYGHKGVVEILLKNKAPVNSRAYCGHTPLHVAASGGYYDITALLIKNNADVNAKDKHGVTPLNRAVLHGHCEIVGLLIENGAKVDSESDLNLIPLNLAIESGHKKVIEILLANGANINGKSRNGSPLISAILNNNKKIVKVLIERGADVNADCGKPLSVAVVFSNQDVIHLLLTNHARVDIKDPEDITPLHLAAREGRTEIVNLLISRGANVNALSTTVASPLSYAAEKGQAEVVKILLAKGANVNDISSPLHVAAAQGHTDVVNILLQNGADVNLLDSKSRTALQLAVQHGHLPVIEEFMQYKKVNLEARGTNNMTLLLIAAQKINLKMVKYLVDKGCNIHAKDNLGSKCIHVAAGKGLRDIVEFLLSKGMDINEPGALGYTPLHFTAINHQVEVAKYLLTKGAQINAKGDYNSTPLHVAVRYNSLGVFKVLLQNGAVFNADDIDFQPPVPFTKIENTLFWVDDKTKHTFFENKTKIVELLSSTKNLFDSVKRNSSSDVEKFIKRGAFVNAKNKGSVATPLHYGAWKGYEDIVSILLQNKADPNMVCDKGYTALHYAAKFSHLGCVKILMCHGAIYNALSETGKTPVALSEDKNIIYLFEIIDDSFKKIKNNDARVIDDLNKVHVDDLKAIMNARSTENWCLISAALQSNFQSTKKLEFISQDEEFLQYVEATSSLNLGNYEHSVDIFKNLIEKKTKLLGPDNPSTLEMQSCLGIALFTQGNYSEALDMLEKTLRKQEKNLGSNCKDTLETRTRIALVLHRQRKFNDALDVYRTVYSKRKEILGPHHDLTVDSYFRMADVLQELEKYEEALNVNLEILKIKKETLGPGHMDTIKAQEIVGTIYFGQGRYEEALIIFNEVLERKKEIVGINHGDTLVTMQYIARVFIKQDKFQEALKTYEEILNIQKGTLQQNHPEVLKTQLDIADVHCIQHKYVDAFKLYKQCYDQRVNVFGSSHPGVSIVYEKMELIIKDVFQMECIPSQFLHYLQKEITIASSEGDIRTVIRLLENGVNINHADTNGKTPLYFAVNNGRRALINVLLKKGADVTLKIYKGTLLHVAASKDYKQIAQVLLQHVDKDNLQNFVNSKTTSGRFTSLHVAAKSGHLETMKLLLRNGAIYDVQNKKGKTPIDLATDQKTVELFKLIEELFKLVEEGSVELIDKLKTLKPDEFTVVTNARCSQGHGLLQVAIIYLNKRKQIADSLLAMIEKQN